MFYGILAAVVAGAVGLDQLTKWLTVQNLREYEMAESSFLGLFRFTYHRNGGAAWSMLEGQTWLFLLVLALFIVALGVMIYKKWISKKPELLAMACILGGALGNAIDRIFRANGEVVDMIKFDFWMEFPTFNVADIFITLGCAFLFIYVLFFDKKEETKEE